MLKYLGVDIHEAYNPLVPFVFYLFIYLFIYLFSLFRATAVACGASQARGQIRAVGPGLHHSHSSTRSEPHLQPTPQLTATPDP